MRPIICAAIVLSACPAVAGEKEDAAHFSAVRRELTKRLPPGWELRTDLKIGATPSDPPRPRIVIRSKKRLTVEFIPPSSSPLRQRARQEFVEVDLVFARYVSPKDYGRMKAENVKRDRQRSEFCRKHFAGMRFRDIKGGRLDAPHLLKPRTDEQRRRLLEYTFLWLKTVPHDLPTCRYKTLSFSVFQMPYLVLKEERGSYATVLKAIDAVLTRYE